jgi:hypothetical protein
MSLTVSPALVARAQQGEVDDAEFVGCIRDSLPYAWTVVTALVDRLNAGAGDFADNQTPPPDEASRGQVLRMMASDAMRAALERHFDVRLAFQNCHRVAVFHLAAESKYREFVTSRAQILNQRPDLVDC